MTAILAPVAASLAMLAFAAGLTLGRRQRPTTDELVTAARNDAAAARRTLEIARETYISHLTHCTTLWKDAA
ncbi:hypothetical protein LO762_16525 [Actinocorallia sp. API 0066]|uniref:hypothetical protein n=1 Tax=Actinocorallia sp. API 0066 TaxID=2896846 RepID=UPI001E52E8AF|nr:hypothetical protein [Actinocorallia sp. API 0066]MCD0450784.1 hypothetical protein [Actinocorallia sp. API 0066]